MNDIEIERQNRGCVNQRGDAADDDEIGVVISELLKNRTKRVRTIELPDLQSQNRSRSL